MPPSLDRGSRLANRALDRQRLLSGLLAPLYYAVLDGALRLRLKSAIIREAEFRAKVWSLIDSNPGPLIWVANHCTLADSWIINWAVFSLGTAFRRRAIPWSVARTSIYYPSGSDWRSRAARLAVYLGRVVPLVNEGSEEAKEASRRELFETFVRILGDGGSVFFFPEAGLSSNGWFEPRKPKDFVGRLAAAVPQAAILCIYCRGEGQATSTPGPRSGETYRLEAELLRPTWDAGTPPREIASKVFEAIGALQERWFKGSAMPKNCGGNDVIDLKMPLLKEHFTEQEGRLVPEPEWAGRHLTSRERERLLDRTQVPDPFVHFWKLFAAKEAAYKALVQAGLDVPAGGYHMLEADLFREKVTHLPSGSEVDVRFAAADENKLHCVAVFRGGYIGDPATPGDVVSGLEEIPPGADASEAARRGLLRLIAESLDDIRSTDELAVASEDGIPKVLRAGRPCDWGVSLSHSGRYVGYSFIAT